MKKLFFLICLFACATCVYADQVKGSFVYDEALDRLTARLWMETNGIMVRNSLTSSDKLGDAQIDIFDDATNAWLPTQTIAHPPFSDTTASMYRIDFENVAKGGNAIQLVPGKTYFARCQIHYGGAQGDAMVFETGMTFTMVVSQSLMGMTGEISGLQSQVMGVQSAFNQEMALTRDKLSKLKTSTSGTLVASETTISDKITAETGAVKTQVTTAGKSALLNREALVLLGETLTIRYRTYENAAPVISVYDPSHLIRVASVRMTEGSPAGVYSYPVTFALSWPVGVYTIVCSESSYGTMDAMTITVKLSNIETVSNDVSAAMGSVTPITSASKTVKSLSQELEAVERNLNQAADALARSEKSAKVSGEVANRVVSMYNSLKELSGKIKDLGGVKEDKFFEMSDARAKDFDYIRNKTQEMKAILELNKQLLENTAKEGVEVETWMEFR
jgi:hypothetical protein